MCDKLHENLKPVSKPSRLAAAGILLLGLSACASTAPKSRDLSPILPASESRLETAPPAARDALEAGLRWIAEDAPETNVESRPDVQLAKGGGS